MKVSLIGDTVGQARMEYRQPTISSFDLAGAIAGVGGSDLDQDHRTPAVPENRPGNPGRG